MTTELSPNYVACNLDCDYCYQKPLRDAGNVSHGYDLQLMKAGLEREGTPFSLHGGEALLTPLPVLEELFAYGWDRWKQNGVQTNGTLITETHLALFKQYKVHVGFSIDGPDELNDSRWAGTLEKTREATAKSHAALRRCVEEQIPRSVIITLYRGNAVGERLTRLIDWIAGVHDLGVVDIRIHLLEVESPQVRSKMALSVKENIVAMLELYALQQRLPTLRLDVFKEMAQMLIGKNAGTCVWHACDPYTTAAVRGVNGMGESSNCERTNKEGVDFQKATTPGYERQVALYRTPQADNGCQGCRFFYACKGHCPGTAVDGDWRNRTEHCGVWMHLFARLERDLVDLGVTPVTRSPLLPAMERVMVDGWAAGQNIPIAEALWCAQTGKPPRTNSGRTDHGDHWDAPEGYAHSDGTLVVHGDRGTTDMHGDSG